MTPDHRFDPERVAASGSASRLASFQGITVFDGTSDEGTKIDKVADNSRSGKHFVNDDGMGSDWA